MATISFEERDMKELVKQAIVELLEERQDLFRELFAEAIEDVSLIEAIKEGEATPNVNRREIIDILESAD
jgi:ribosomal protein L12E/L44/L45/RPP1/RPP2